MASGLADLALAAGRRAPTDTTDSSSVVDVITFIEAPWGLGLRLFPIQRVILKAHYGLQLDDNPYGFDLAEVLPPDHPEYRLDLIDDDGYYLYRIPVSDWRRQNLRYLTEAGYLRFLYDEGRCNVREVIPGSERREMVLSVGRRSGKTLITSCIIAYEAYKLLLKGNPQKYYGSSQSNVIQLISVATDKDQAGLLYREASGHFSKCDFFKAYMANATQSFATFQTPYDIDKYGSYKDNPKARYSINVTFRSCVAKGLRGGANILVALDEVAHFTDEGQSSADDVYQAVEPSTRTFSPKDPKNTAKPIGENEGRIILISSPLGKQGLFYKQYMLGYTGGLAAENMLCIEAPTWEVNPTVPAGTFEGSYLKDPRVFFTEFGAQFSDRTRGWIENADDLFACLDPNLKPRLSAPARQPHFMGLDVALVGDYTSIAVGHVTLEGKVQLDYIERIRAGEGVYRDLERLDFDDVADWVLSISKRFYITEGMFDQWSGIPMEQALAKRGLSQMKSVHHTRNLTSQMFQNFKDMMLDKRLALFDHPIESGKEHADYILELLELQAEAISKYVILVEAPNMEGKHDDYSDALVRMVWQATAHASKANVVVGHRKAGGTLHHRSPSSPGSLLRLKRSGSHPDRIIPKKGLKGR
jgi:hypothetical protein